MTSYRPVSNVSSLPMMSSRNRSPLDNRGVGQRVAEHVAVLTGDRAARVAEADALTFLGR